MDIRGNIERVRDTVAETALRCGRGGGEIALCAVSKFQPRQAVEAAYTAGARLFGESRVQEMCEKLPHWKNAHNDAQIHFIGHLQRNKVKKALEVCSCVQSVDSGALLYALEAEAAKMGKTIDILFEINCGESAKSGYASEAAFFEDIERALDCRALRIKGLMAMAPFSQDERVVRAAFRRVHKLFCEARRRYPEADWSILSMGMSGDYRIAIEEGSTMVRIGTAIFGERACGLGIPSSKQA